MKLRTIDEIPELSGKKILLRLSLNVPVKSGEISDDFRLQKILPVLRALVAGGSRVTVISHLGRAGDSLAPVADYLRAHVSGSFIVRDNLRRDPREESGDESFARELAAGQDVFVNEDFPVSHRLHASVVGIPKILPSFAGYQFVNEIESLGRFLDPPQPCVIILGGAKIETKLPMIKSFLPKAEKIFLGSYFANESDSVPMHEKVVLPVDSVKKDGRVLDVGPRTLTAMQDAVRFAASVIWNGPLGKFEDGYDETTLELAETIAHSKTKSVVGGGDSVAAIRNLNILDRFTFVSTGGGAMLDFLAHGTLPGIEALLASPK